MLRFLLNPINFSSWTGILAKIRQTKYKMKLGTEEKLSIRLTKSLKSSRNLSKNQLSRSNLQRNNQEMTESK